MPWNCPPESLPICACGCGQRVKRPYSWRKGEKVTMRWHSRECMKRDWEEARRLQRRHIFEKDLRQFLGRRIAQSDMLDLLEEVHRRGRESMQASQRKRRGEAA
jgi:hypothetical protein